MWPKETDLMSKDTHRMKTNIWEMVFYPENYKKHKYMETNVNKKINGSIQKSKQKFLKILEKTENGNINL